MKTIHFDKHHVGNDDGGMNMEPEAIMEKIMKELDGTLKAMTRAKSLEERETFSRVVKNLSESLGVFFNLASDMMSFDEDDFDDDFDEDDDDEDDDE